MDIFILIHTQINIDVKNFKNSNGNGRATFCEMVKDTIQMPSQPLFASLVVPTWYPMKLTKMPLESE